MLLFWFEFRGVYMRCGATKTSLQLICFSFDAANVNKFIK